MRRGVAAAAMLAALGCSGRDAARAARARDAAVAPPRDAAPELVAPRRPDSLRHVTIKALGMT